jgi:hypothetical protein
MKPTGGLTREENAMSRGAAVREQIDGIDKSRSQLIMAVI